MALAFAGWIAPAHANVDKTFSATGVFNDGSTLGGSLIIDVTAGSVISSALTFSKDPSEVFSTIVSQGFDNTTSVYLFFEEGTGSADELRSGALTTTLINYNGSMLDSENFTSPTGYASDWQNSIGTRINLTYGQLVPVAEPESLAILVMGIMGLLFVRRLRVRLVTYSCYLRHLRKPFHNDIQSRGV